MNHDYFNKLWVPVYFKFQTYVVNKSDFGEDGIIQALGNVAIRISFEMCKKHNHGSFTSMKIIDCFIYFS